MQGPSRQAKRLVILAAVAALSSTVKATDVFWTDTTDDFSTSTDWTPNAPGAGDNAIVANGGAPVITQDTTVNDVRAGDNYRQGGPNDVSGAGTVTQNSGNLVVNGWLRVASSDVGNGQAAGTPVAGTYNLNGGTITVKGQQFSIGESGNTGTLNISGGTITASQAFFVGQLGGGNTGLPGTGIVNQTGGTINPQGWLSVGGNGGSTGTYNISGGTINATGDLNIGDVGAGTHGTLNLSGTGVVSGKNVFIGKNDTVGVVNQTGGTFTVGAGNLNLSGNADSAGTYSISGGTLDGGKNKINVGAGTATFTFTGGQVQNFSAINLPLTQGGGVFQPGAPGAPSVATLTGNGTTAYNQTAGVFHVDIVGGVNDELVANSGAVSLAGTLSVHDDALQTPGTQFTILDPQSPIAGSFSNAPEGGTVTADNGQAFKITYLGGDGDNVVLTAVSVPEPATLGLLGTAALGLLARRRRA